MISRTGYIGEDGFEIYFEPEFAPYLWLALVSRLDGVLAARKPVLRYRK